MNEPAGKDAKIFFSLNLEQTNPILLPALQAVFLDSCNPRARAQGENAEGIS